MRPSLADGRARRAARLLVALAGAAAACGSRLDFADWRDPGGYLSAEVPRSWKRDGDPSLARKPVAVVSFVGKVTAQDEGIALGAVINISRICRRRADVPGGDAAFKKFESDWLLRSDALFGGPTGGLTAAQKAFLSAPRRTVVVGGLPARLFDQEYTQSNAVHMDKPVAMRIADAVVQTPEAYYVLEYRATRELFDRYYPAFERLVATASFPKPSG